MLKKTLMWIWQMPQHILALVLIKVLKAKRDANLEVSAAFDGQKIKIYVDHKSKFFGISLGEYVILGTESAKLKFTIDHEYGHSLQSRMLGPLYLIIVGIPSIVMNMISRWNLTCGDGMYGMQYYDRWPENWADRLGKVDCMERGRVTGFY